MSLRWLARSKPLGGAPAALRYRRSPHVQSAVHGDSMVLLDLRSEQFFALDQVGASVWTQLAEPTAVNEIVDGLVERYDAPETEIRRDVQDLLVSLIGNGLVEDS